MDKILLAHGSGGRQAHELISGLIVEAFGNSLLDALDDAAALFTEQDAPHGPLAFTTDSYVVKPRFFPGGDIGKLAVCGTVNDLAVSGARPLYLSCGFIIEEGLPIDDFKRILTSMSDMLRATGARIVTGDTKVVERGAADGIFINTAGVGAIELWPMPAMSLVRPGNLIIISGPIGDHGVAVMASREGLKFNVPVQSDCAPLWELVSAASAAAPGGVRFMRDPTRGGLATVLNEIAASTRLGIELDEKRIPLTEGVEALCELLGLDPLYVANEGKIAFVVSKSAADSVLAALRAHPLGARAEIIGSVTDAHPGKVVLRTVVGGTRIVDMLTGEQLPRIC